MPRWPGHQCPDVTIVSRLERSSYLHLSQNDVPTEDMLDMRSAIINWIKGINSGGGVISTGAPNLFGGNYQVTSCSVRCAAHAVVPTENVLSLRINMKAQQPC